MKLLWDIRIFFLGGLGYGIIELIWRQRTHWTMLLLGGLCFLSLYKLFNRFKDFTLPEKCVMGAGVITAMELVTGCIFNLGMGLTVWNYSRVPLNLWGQVCVIYSTLWGILCIPINYISLKLGEQEQDCEFAKK